MSRVNLPLLLAGPILRRVEPTLVSVWVALRDPCDVTLRIWEGRGGRAENEQRRPLVSSPVTRTLRVGAQLHLVAVTAKMPDTSGTSFQADSLYSYDLHVQVQDTARTQHTLDSLHMLDEGVFDGFFRLPLGFEPGLLPSFAPPPSELTDLNLLYGSCRRPNHTTPDALAMVDDLISGDDRYKDPRARPHQLFLGGDQIYADDVDRLHMLLVEQTSLTLIGTTGEDEFPVPVEHLPLDQVLKLEDEAKAAGPTPLDGYLDEPPDITAENPFIPADRAHFPEGRRLQLTLHDAQLTSTDGSSHLLSLGEFAALYLSVWSPAVWGTDVGEAMFVPKTTGPSEGRPLRWDAKLPPYTGKPEQGAIVMPPVPFADRVPGHLYVLARGKPGPAPDEVKQQSSLRADFANLQSFLRGLPKVQRALANVPTYMIFDDHDVTDDYFLNPIWRNRVLGKKLGRAIVGNGMIAYALFQDWGNDPVAYESGPKARLLALIAQLFPAGQPKGPDVHAFQEIGTMLGHDQALTQTPDGRFSPVNPELKWHFTIDGPKHRAIVLDNRTRRSYASPVGPPGNVSVDAMVDQIPLPPLPAGREILIVVAPLQVIGPPVLDEIVAPLSYRVFDLVQACKTESPLHSDSTAGPRGMTGTNPDAIEAWAFDADTFEHLLKRLEPYGRVVLLSGDVHYSSGTLMSYWRGKASQPARFAQFTSSGFKNVMPPFITLVDRAVGFAQQLIRLDLGTERLGWEQPLDQPVLLPEGKTELDLLPVMRSRLKSVPVRLPTWGWPDQSRLNPDKPPDWSWRAKPLRDGRDDRQRPRPIQLLALEDDVEAKLGDPATVLAGYQRVAARHQHALGRLRNARQILFRGNVGRVRFEAKSGGRLDAIHEVLTSFTDPDEAAAADPKVEPYLVQRAALGPEDEPPPTVLRQRALEIPKLEKP